VEKLLSEDKFNAVADSDKMFIITFDSEIEKFGYSCGGIIGKGGKWWQDISIKWAKVGIKTERLIARIYQRDNKLILRLYFNKIDKHRDYIENAPTHIKEIFTGSHGNCGFDKCPCKTNKLNCKFRKSYTLDGKAIHKCNGITFEVLHPDISKLPDYIDLLSKFYARKNEPSQNKHYRKLDKTP